MRSGSFPKPQEHWEMSLRKQLAFAAMPGAAYVGPNERLYAAATVNKAVIDSHRGKYPTPHHPPPPTNTYTTWVKRNEWQWGDIKTSSAHRHVASLSLQTTSCLQLLEVSLSAFCGWQRTSPWQERGKWSQWGSNVEKRERGKLMAGMTALHYSHNINVCMFIQPMPHTVKCMQTRWLRTEKVTKHIPTHL